MHNNTGLKRILYLEDEADIRTIANLALTTLGGFEVLSCSSGAEVLRDGPAYKPQLLLFDVMLPEMDGPAVLAHLRELPGMQEIPVIFMTNKVLEADVAHYRKLGAIGIIPKPFNPNTLADELRALWLAQFKLNEPAPNTHMVSFAHKLIEMAQGFGHALPHRVNALEQLAIKSTQSQEHSMLAIREAHTLAGSGGTFGYTILSELMREIEQLLTEQNKQADPAIQTNLSKLFFQIRKRALAPQKSVAELLGMNKVRKPKGAREKLIYFCDDDEMVAESFTLQIEKFGFEVKYFNKVDSLIKAAAKRMPEAMILDIDFPAGRLAGLEGLTAVQALSQHPIPTIFMSAHTDIWARLGAVRAGGQAYVTKPADVGYIIDQLDRLLGIQDVKSYRVMLIDDDPLTVEFVSTILHEAGMTVKALNDPMRILQVAREFNPELILMDMYMPGVQGHELAAVIRQDPQMISIPIVYLSAEQDAEKQIAAMRNGADDFILKPINPPYFVNTIACRVLRYRDLRQLMSIDGLSGLVNHSNLLEQLEYELSRSIRQKTSLVYAMIDLDHFKSVNDNHGHLVGDLVIKSLARLLKERLRKTDIIGRYGGEEFGVIMPDTAINDAIAVLEKIREIFSEIQHKAVNQSFNVTFSCGAARRASTYTTVSELVTDADNALYKAKNNGRNCIVSGFA